MGSEESYHVVGVPSGQSDHGWSDRSQRPTDQGQRPRSGHQGQDNANQRRGDFELWQKHRDARVRLARRLPRRFRAGIVQPPAGRAHTPTDQ